MCVSVCLAYSSCVYVCVCTPRRRERSTIHRLRIQICPCATGSSLPDDAYASRSAQGAGRRAQGAGRRAQGAGRRAQGAGKRSVAHRAETEAEAQQRLQRLVHELKSLLPSLQAAKHSYVNMHVKLFSLRLRWEKAWLTLLFEHTECIYIHICTYAM
jgi:hypothetical protein